MELFSLANDMGLLDETAKNDDAKYTMNVDYYDLEHGECINGDFDVEIDNNGYVRFDRVLPEGALVDGTAFYRNDEYMFCVENPYSATAILKYVYVQMLTRGATEEEINYIREQIRRDCPRRRGRRNRQRFCNQNDREICLFRFLMHKISHF